MRLLLPIMAALGAFCICGQSPPAKPLKIFIAVDSEGQTGLASYWAHEPAAPLFEERRKLLMNDVNAAVEGCLAAGATEVVVSDDTANGTTINLLELHPAAKLIQGRGFGSQVVHWLHGLDSSFAGVMLVGTHAMEGTPDGVLAHTLTGVSQKHRRYFYNGRESGEIAMYAIVASHFKVPVIMVTGCAAASREAKQMLGPETVTVAVKQGFNTERALMLHPRQTRKMIADAAAEAVAKIGRFQPYPIELPIKIRLEFPTKQFADEHQASRLRNHKDWPGVRVNETTFEVTIQSPLDRNLVL